MGCAVFFLFILTSTRWMGSIFFFFSFLACAEGKNKVEPYPKYLNIYMIQFTRCPILSSFFLLFITYLQGCRLARGWKSEGFH